jgi:hypothetical protein
MMTLTSDTGGESGKAIAVQAPVIANAAGYSSQIRDSLRETVSLSEINLKVKFIG